MCPSVTAVSTGLDRTLATPRWPSSAISTEATCRMMTEMAEVALQRAWCDGRATDGVNLIEPVGGRFIGTEEPKILLTACLHAPYVD